MTVIAFNTVNTPRPTSASPRVRQVEQRFGADSSSQPRTSSASPSFFRRIVTEGLTIGALSMVSLPILLGGVGIIAIALPMVAKVLKPNFVGGALQNAPIVTKNFQKAVGKASKIFLRKVPKFLVKVATLPFMLPILNQTGIKGTHASIFKKLLGGAKWLGSHLPKLLENPTLASRLTSVPETFIGQVWHSTKIAFGLLAEVLKARLLGKTGLFPSIARWFLGVK